MTSLLSSLAMALKRSSTFPPFASMHTRNFVATSNRRASYSAKALWNAKCRAFVAVPCALSKRRFCMSALLLKDVSSWRMGSTSSGISATSFVRHWISFCTPCSTVFASSTAASTVAAFTFRSSTSSWPASFPNASAPTSASRILPSRLLISDMSSVLFFDSSSSFTPTKAWRFSASSLSRFSFSIRAARFTRLLSSSRAMPTAVFRT
mmetsp:Transcript_91607/g.255128  ORF Transcript_91607/g.255128 Transcript_91607/m.255128 type:complete len:208 (+) Transcript_91607:1239-1862(+)